VTNPTSGAQLFVRIIHPQGWEGAALPALVLVPGGSSWSSDFTDPPNRGQTIADGGYTVVVFDPDGRGSSGGEENDNGFVQQDGLAAVVSFAATLAEVDSSQIGMVSYSFGITMAAGALARYPDLPVRFLLDWEGPADRNDTGGCDESRVGHLQFMSCDDEEFWGEREAATFARDLQMPYQRLQCEQDHAQPDSEHTLLMVANATAVEYGGNGRAPWTRLNDLEPNTVYAADSSVSLLPQQVCRALEPLVIRQVEELFDLE
jgi:pimeloyl-ACP methyl ester carboxylesterase